MVSVNDPIPACQSKLCAVRLRQGLRRPKAGRLTFPCKGKEYNLSPSRGRLKRGSFARGRSLTWHPLILLFLCIISSIAFSQHSVRLQLLKQESSAIVLPPFSPDSTVAVSPRQTKSPTLAIMLSAILPGAGQVYTERYWKIPLIWGFGAYFASVWNKANDLYQRARDRYQTSVDQKVNGGLGDAQTRYERDFYHDERDRFAFYIAITYALNIIDAYVGASLYNFDVSDELGGNAKLQMRIPLH